MGAADDILTQLAASSPQAPVMLGRYDVVGRLGQGGMGTVYDAIDRERGTRVALKTVSVPDAAAGMRIKREFRVVSDLAHPQLAPVYELATEQGVWFFAMERIDGVGLLRWARGPSTAERGTAPLPLTQAKSSDLTRERVAGAMRADDVVASPPSCTMDALRIALADLARGLCALHDAGLRHGDVKPENMLVRPDGRLVIVDFGLAEAVGEAHSRGGPTAGTPQYMAPEQLRGTHVEAASDWYAVGTLLYEVLTGRPPFDADSLLDLYFQKTHHTPPSPADLIAETPADLSDVTMALLQPTAEHRPRGADLLRMFAGDDAVRPVLPPVSRSTFVGRKRELRMLEQTYGLARSGHPTVVHARGPSGIGKSALLASFTRGVRDIDNALPLHGRCYERESVPYKAFDGIVDDLADALQGASPEAIARLVPEWIGELVQMFPALAAVPELAARATPPALSVDAVEQRRRAWAALRDLLAAVSRDRPVVLSIDDVQWADADSARLLEVLVRELGDSRLLVVCGIRPDEAAGNPVLQDYFAFCRELAASRKLVEIPIEPLPAPEAEVLARSMLRGLGGSVDETKLRFLAEEASGVPFFIEELARFAAIQERAALSAPISLDEAIRARMRALPAEQRALVELVAVSGRPIPQAVLFDAARLAADALPVLLSLVHASLLGWSGASATDVVSTYHDRIREVAFASVDADARCAHHLALGRAHLARNRGQAAGAWIFEAVRHFAAAGPALHDADERLAAARLALDAAALARRSAAFPVAFECCERGIALLSPDVDTAWDRHYELCLALHAGAAEYAYLSADWAAMEARCSQVKARARTTLDQVIAWEVQIDANVGRHRYAAALDIGLQALALLGVELPRDPGPTDVATAFQRALADLERVGPKALEAMPDVADPIVAAAMRLQARIAPAAYFGKPPMLAIIACNLIETSVARGLSPATPYALAVFGIVLNSAGMFPVSHGWGQLAVRLVERWPDRKLEAATRHVVYNLVGAWMVPLRSVLPPLREVWDIGRRTGDLEYASYAAHGYVHNCMYAGLPLGPLVVEALALGVQMRSLGQVNALHVHRPFEQLLRALTGQLADPSRLDDAGFSESAELAAATRDGSRSGSFILHLVIGLARYHFGAARDACEHFELARSFLDAAPSVWHVPIFHQFAVLAGCATWNDTPPDVRPLVAAHLDASVAELRTLAGHTPINFAHRVSLAEAALARRDGDMQRAEALLARALVEAREGQWHGDVALVHELAGAREAACAAYEAWGATAKAARLSRLS